MLPRELLAAVDVLVVNEHEAAALAGDGAPDGSVVDPSVVDPSVVERVRPLARRLLAAVPAVVVTLGAQGALVVVRDGGPDGVHVPGREVEAVDTTGAGDVFGGALVAELEAARGSRPGAPAEAVLVDAARFATAAAALSVQSPGASASAPHRSDVEALLGGDGARPGAGSSG